MTIKAGNTENTEQLMSMEVSVTNHYGAQSVEMTLGGSFVVKTPDDTDKIFDMLSRRVLDLQKKYATNHLGGAQPQAQNATGNSSPADRTFVDEPVETATPELFKGKIMAKVKFGRYRKFGVPCWAEVWGGVEGLPEPDDNGDIDLAGWIATVEYKGDKAVRVTKLVPSVANSSEG